MKTSNLSSESATSTTSSSSVSIGRDEVAAPIVGCSGETTFGIPSNTGTRPGRREKEAGSRYADPMQPRIPGSNDALWCLEGLGYRGVAEDEVHCS